MNYLEKPQLGQTTANTPIVLSVIEERDKSTKPLQIALFGCVALALILMVSSYGSNRKHDDNGSFRE